MQTVLAQILFLLLIPNTAQAQECGWASSETLIAEAQEEIKHFHSQSFDPFFYLDIQTLSASDLEKKWAAASTAREVLDADQRWREFSFGATIMEILSDLLRTDVFASLSSHLRINLFPDGKCSGIACTVLDGATMVHVNGHQLADFQANVGSDKFVKVLKMIVGHEAGHYVQLGSLTHEHGSFKSGATMTSQNNLKYHLVVDAISMIANGVTIDEYLEALKLFNGTGSDIDDRISCLEKIAD